MESHVPAGKYQQLIIKRLIINLEMKTRLIFMMACIIAVFLTSCNSPKGKLPKGELVKDYSVVTLSLTTVTIHKNFPATIEGQQVIEIRPMISGYIKEILVNEGDRVSKGQLLFRISNPQYQQDVLTAKASISSAVAEVNAAKMEIEKVRPLVEKQIVSDYRLKSAELALEAKEAALAQANAALANAEANLSYTSIRSPQDGIIGTIPHKIGSLVGSNMTEALTTLSDIKSVLAYFSWNEKQLLDFLSHSPGTSLEEKVRKMPQATLILANSQEYPLKGKIELASGLIVTETGSATLKAIFPNTNGIIRSGSSAVVSIPEVLDSVLVVPQGATYELQDKRFIYKVNPDNKVSAVSFTSVPSDDGKYFLVTVGLKAGDKVVVEGVASLKDGSTIRPKEADAANHDGKNQ
jgi:membrane fusion protein, multidrug efflux system